MLGYYRRVLTGAVFVLLPFVGVMPAVAQNGDGYQPSDSYQDDNGGRRRYDQSYDRSYDAGSRGAQRDSYGGGANDAYRPPREDQYGSGRGDSFSDRRADYGDSYSPPPGGSDSGYPDPQPPGYSNSNSYEQNEIVAAGHGFFGAVSKGLAGAIEYAFKNEGRPNGYILGEDAGGAFMVGLRYGEGKLFTKDAGVHKVFWQGPSLGYDMGAEGSKTMVLVYNLRDPGEIYERFAGAEGSAYLVGGVSLQFQTYGRVKLGVIRSGIGLRLGANIGYSKYSRSPTWNPL